MIDNPLQISRDAVDLTKMKMLGAAMNSMYKTMRFYTVVLAVLKKDFDYNGGSLGTDGKNLFIDPNFIAGESEESLILKLAQAEEEFKMTFQGANFSQKKLNEYLERKRIWFSRKSILEIAFTLCHEARHIISETILRSKSYDKKFFKYINIASDYQINNRLCYEMFKGDIEKMYREVPLTRCLYVSNKYFKIEKGDYIEWTMEEILEDLLKKYKEDFSEYSLLDEHIEIDDGSAEHMKHILISSSRNGMGGDVPMDIKKQIEEWTEPKIIWHKYLDKNIKANMKYDFDYSVPCESSWSDSIVLRDLGYLSDNSYVINPSESDGNILEVVVVFDTSGSIFCDDQLVRTLCGELCGIVSQFQNSKVHIMCFDTKIHNYQVFDNMNVFDIKDYQLSGGGGSDIKGLIPFMEENSIPKKNVVVFTDLYISIDWTGYKDFKNLTWVVFNNKRATIPYGFKINY